MQQQKHISMILVQYICDLEGKKFTEMLPKTNILKQMWPEEVKRLNIFGIV